MLGRTAALVTNTMGKFVLAAFVRATEPVFVMGRDMRLCEELWDELARSGRRGLTGLGSGFGLLFGGVAGDLGKFGTRAAGPRVGE